MDATKTNSVHFVQHVRIAAENDWDRGIETNVELVFSRGTKS